MADISITDQLQVSADLVTINDNSPFALSQLTHLDFSNVPVIGDFAKPVDQCSFQNIELGAAVSSPPILLGNQANLVIKAGQNAQLFVCPPKIQFLFAHDGSTPQLATDAGKNLFGPEEYTPDIAIQPGQCWAGLELDTSLTETVGGAFDGFGIAVSHSTDVRFGTYVLFTSPVPNLKQALKTVLETYAVAITPQAIRNQPAGTVRTIGTTGQVAVSASYSVPMAVNPLASANLPFQFKLAIQPSATLQLTGGITLTGDFAIRAHRVTETTLVLGLFKKKDTAFSATFTARAGIAADLGATDILTPILNAVIPGPALDGLSLDTEQAAELKAALSSCVDQSFSAALNACCSASLADEAAMVYSIDLTQATEQTGRALASALRGDWSALESLPNAKILRNVVTEIHERKHQLNINLLGLLNATSIHDYLKQTQVLHDGAGQIVLVDTEGAKSLAASDTPYAAKPDKLRSALAQAFLTTISYSAASAKLAIKSFTIRQTYLDYKAKASAQDLGKYIRLAKAVGVSVVLQTPATVNYAKCYLDAQYSLAEVMQVFYADPSKRLARTQQDLDRIGRDSKLALLDPKGPSAMARRMALSSDPIWQAMRANGNVANFRFIEGIASLPDPARAAISADWVDIAWWSDAMRKIPAKLTAVLEALDASTGSNPLEDAAFMARQKELQSALAEVTANTQSAFGDGWGLAVIYRCATAGFVTLDIGWNKQFQHYETGAQTAAGAGG
jgi:hypothetical protein